MIAMEICFACREIFSFDSTRFETAPKTIFWDDHKQPVCHKCWATLNVRRIGADRDVRLAAATILFREASDGLERIFERSGMVS
jgi:hypothetical protein